jgi:hypothetical protein
VSRLFTLSEAEALLPSIDRLIRNAVAQKGEYQEVEIELQAITQRVMVSGGMTLDRDAVGGFRARRDRAAEAIKEALQAIQETGCEVKDLDIGLVDFPTLFHGDQVYLCWRMGEPSIRYWHGEEGFRGRKEIDEEFLRNHRGDD